MKAEGKRIRVDSLSRVEGEGGIVLEIRDGIAAQVKVTIFEAPRFFEAFLQGRSHADVPDFTARICGICPLAYQMSSVHAMEKIFGVHVDPFVRDLRRLLYCAEWIESHALHIYFLNGPDFYGLESAWASRDYLPILTRGLGFKKLGNDLLALLGGRSVHPISVCVGGLTRAPRKKDLMAFLPAVERAFEASLKEIAWAATLPFPEAEFDTTWVSLVHDEEYPMNEGLMGCSKGKPMPMEDFLTAVKEFQVAYSTALHAGIREATDLEPYLVGPISRVNLNRDRLPSAIQDAMKSSGIVLPIRNTRMAIAARTVEMAYALCEAARLIRRYEEAEKAFVPYEPLGGEAVWVTEAPRGSLLHRYRLNEVGYVESCTIVPSTSQNLAHMEKDLRLFVERHADGPVDWIRKEAEKIIRCNDPCISCAVHVIRPG